MYSESDQSDECHSTCDNLATGGSESRMAPLYKPSKYLQLPCGLCRHLYLSMFGCGSSAGTAFRDRRRSGRFRSLMLVELHSISHGNLAYSLFNNNLAFLSPGRCKAVRIARELRIVAADATRFWRLGAHECILLPKPAGVLRSLSVVLKTQP